MIKIIELFAGVGAQVAALKRLGIEYETVGISEIDRFAIQSYEAINGPTHNYGNITKIPALDYADLWTYSFPCQDLSVAGKQAGISEGTRSGLLLHVERLLETAVSSGNQPKYLLLENVKALVSKKFKPDFDRWLEKLDSLGYNNYWQVLNAKDYGVPQNRERVFVVSIRKDVDTKGYKFPEKIPLTRKLKDVLESVVDEKYYLSQDKVDKLLMNIPDTSYCIDANYYKGTTLRNYEEKHRRQLVCTPCVCGGGSLDGKHTWDIVGVQHIGNINGRDSHGGFAGDIFNPEGLSPTLNTMQGGNRMPYICASRGGNPENPSDRTAGAPTEQRLEVNQTGCCNTLTSVQKDNYLLEPLHIKEATQKGFADAYEGDSVSLDQPNSSTRRGRVGNQISNTLTCSCNTGVVQILDEQNGYVRKDGCVGTLTTDGSSPKHNNRVIENNYRIRKLTPLECWRLMDFTDEEFYAAQSSGVSNSQLYKQAGNSIVVAVLVGIFRNLLQSGEETIGQFDLFGGIK